MTRTQAVFLITMLSLFGGSALSAQKLHSRKAPGVSEEPVVASNDAPGQPQPRTLLSVEGYEHLLNILFPADHAVKPGLDYTLVLRFEPTRHPESQVVMHRWHDGKIDAEVDQVLETDAWRTAYQLGADAQTSTLDSVARNILVKHMNFGITDQQVQQWHSELFPLMGQDFSRARAEAKKINKSGTWEAMVNGTRYELWLIAGDEQIHLVSWDHEVDDLPNGSNGLIRWMNLVRWYANGHMVAPPRMEMAEKATPAPAVPVALDSEPKVKADQTEEVAARAGGIQNR